MSSRPLGIALVLVAAATLAGCADAPQPITAVRATAINAFLMSPLVYTGAVTPFTGDALVDVDAVTNTGTVTLNGKAGNDTYDVRITEFAAAADKPFQDGGIATSFHEHGGTGVGDTSIPEVNLLVAGWGKAVVTKNGQALADPVTGMPTWVAHFMLTDTGVFGADKSVKTRAGGIYDPSRAAEGATEADLEFHVSLKNNVGAAQNLTPVEIRETAQGQVQADSTADIPAVASVDIVLFVDTPSPPTPPIAALTLSLKDPTGKEVATLAPGQPGMPATSTVTLADPVPGTYTLSATGQGANAQYGATFTLTPPTEAMLYFVFEDVTIEAGVPASS